MSTAMCNAVQFRNEEFPALFSERQISSIPVTRCAIKTLDELTQSFLEREEVSRPLPREIWSQSSKEEEPVISESAVKPAESIITDKQLRALGKKHLLIMIRDLEKELLQQKKENEYLLMAYQKKQMD